MTRALLIAAMPIAALLSGCSQESGDKAAEIVRPVLSVTVQPRATETYGFAGTVEPRYSAALSFRLLGRIVARDVNVGDTVTKGTTLAALDPTALDLAVQAAKAELSNAEAQAANADASEQRIGQLLASKNVSQAVYDSARQAQHSAGANLERAKAALAKSEEQLGYARLFSDFDGVVTAVGAEVGQTVSPGQMVVTVARADTREAVVDIPDWLTGDLTEQAPFAVSLQSLPSIKTEGRLREMAPQSDETTRTRRVRLSLIDPPSAFRLGSTVTVTRSTSVKPAIELPLSALLEQDGKTQVWIVDEKTATVATHDVQVAARSGTTFTVASGLDAGARVVTAGVHSLTPGQKIKLP